MSDHDVVLACLPELAGSAIEPLGEGDFVRAYRVGGRVVRVPKHPAARAALEREACLMPYIAGQFPIEVPVSRIAVSADGQHAVGVHDALPGEELWHGRWAALDETDRERLAIQVGAFLKRLHDLQVGPGHPCGLREEDPDGLVSRIERRLAADRSIPVTLREPLAGCLAELRDEAGARPRALLHGDLGPGHTLYDPDTLVLTGVIDWGDAFIGDPARDFIFVYEDWGDRFLRHALDGYRPSDPRPFLERIYLHYLADQLLWTLDAAADRPGAISEGSEGLARGLEDLRTARSEG